ncbi:heme o synthase [Lacicoccus alkaliphilus]|uniref:Protoheme IX farnesyltransferase n=1 Tax=Lacicoccus alkaliphilus DSM 16010 TaxID=1123231 RepID=A0A1M7FFK5_9BACL|nr:heme o synthase [Salinicoccus alkaliphilus]SHM02745.1 protoheme IX farnesyltransferase [Salinicoccus alkaliphilus DSM 16010]
MNKDQSPSGRHGFLTNIKYLLKGKVLVANVLPVFTAFWLALHFSGEHFNNHIGTFLLTMLGSTLVIAGALMFNNWYEADLDKKMDRTRNRPTVTGAFTLRAVFRSAVVTSVLGLAIMLLTTPEAALYAFLGWFFYVVLYTFWSKRKYTINTIIGSISGAFTPLIGWAAIAPAGHIVPIMLFYLLFIWQVPHTLAIAIKRLSDYTRAGVPMLPVVSGVDITIRQMIIYVMALLPLPFILLPAMGGIFFIVTVILTVGWIILAFTGLKSTEIRKWAQINLKYSLLYLIIILVIMIIVTI